MFVKNLKGTGEKKCTVCGDWLSHWKLKARRKGTPSCSHPDCDQDAEVGGHVREGIVDPSTKKRVMRGADLIVPLCREHNNAAPEWFLTGNPAVSAEPCPRLVIKVPTKKA